MEFDKRQQAVIRLLQKPSEPGAAALDVIKQTANYASLTKAIRQACSGGAGVPARSGHGGPPYRAIVLRGECAHQKSAWHALLNLARANGVKDYGGGYENFVTGLLKKYMQPLCIVLDHAGLVKGENLATVFKVADHAASRVGLGLRLVLIITREQLYDYEEGRKIFKLPDEMPHLHARQRTWDYNFTNFTLIKQAAKVQLVENLPLLEGQQDEEHSQLKIAV